MVATVTDAALLQPHALSEDELSQLDAYWRAANYLAVGMIYLRGNPLLQEALRPEHVKNRLLGHWGSSPGQAFIWTHANRLIRKYDLDCLYMSGPGHGAPGMLGPCYLDGSYSEVFPHISRDLEGLGRFFKQFSFPGHIGSHCTPETPGSIHEGGELGYVLSHACGSVFDAPELITIACVGDGEAETGPLATSWHINKFLNPVRDGAVLPVLHLNGYKIANPTILSRISTEELCSLLRGYGWTPHLVEGSDPVSMHRTMARVMETAVLEIRSLQRQARDAGKPFRPRWPMIVLRSPKGWTGPKEMDGRRLEGFWRSHQVPLAQVKTDPGQLTALEQWLQSYRPGELFNAQGTPVEMVRSHAPSGSKRMGSNPRANGGLLRQTLRLPPLEPFAVDVERPGVIQAANTAPLGEWIGAVMKSNPRNYRLFGPDETASNRLQAVYAVSKKCWMADMLPEDEDGNGFTHQDPGMIDVAGNKNGEVVRVYLPADANCLLAVAELAFAETDVANIIVSDKQQHLQYLTIEEARRHVAKGAGLWEWACTDQREGSLAAPDVVLASAGDIPTKECLAAIAILRQHLPHLKIRYVNVVKLFCLSEEHPHGLSDADFDSLFTTDRPVVFNFHGYPWLIHRLTYRRTNHHNLHVRGYKEQGNINTPLELAMNNQVDRFNLVIDVINRVPSLGYRAAHLKEHMKEEMLRHRSYAYTHGTDAEAISQWTWPQEN